MTCRPKSNYTYTNQGTTTEVTQDEFENGPSGLRVTTRPYGKSFPTGAGLLAPFLSSLLLPLLAGAADEA